jgi:hypothetical protein
MREALKRDTAQRRAAMTRARLIEKAEAGGYSSASGVNPLERGGEQVAVPLSPRIASGRARPAQLNKHRSAHGRRKRELPSR